MAVPGRDGSKGSRREDDTPDPRDAAPLPSSHPLPLHPLLRFASRNRHLPDTAMTRPSRGPCIPASDGPIAHQPPSLGLEPQVKEAKKLSFQAPIGRDEIQWRPPQPPRPPPPPPLRSLPSSDVKHPDQETLRNTGHLRCEPPRMGRVHGDPRGRCGVILVETRVGV